MQDGSCLSEHELKEAALEEMRFHFVFNTLNSIRYMIYRDQDKAYSMVYDLAVFMRGQMERILSRKMIHISEELRYAKAYALLEEIQNFHMKLEWRCEDMEGYVQAGDVLKAVEAVVKKYIRGAEDTKTLVVEDISGEHPAVRIWVAEEGSAQAAVIDVSDTLPVPSLKESQARP